MARAFSQSFYKSSAWQTVRKQALRRDHYTCCRCDQRAEEVHHIIPIGPENIHDINISLNINNLESLCHTCHTKETKGNDGDIDNGYLFDERGQVVRR